MKSYNVYIKENTSLVVSHPQQTPVENLIIEKCMGSKQYLIDRLAVRRHLKNVIMEIIF